jgi:hypothetical protein
VISASTIVAKVVSFVVAKAATRVGALSVDKRRKACRALTKLYYCVSALDDALQEILEAFDDLGAQQPADSLIHALNNHQNDVAQATNMFVNLSYELEAGLEIIDPALAKTCSVLYWGKYDFLTFMSTCIEWDRSGSAPKMVIYTPTGAMDAVDLNGLYAQSQVALREGDKFYWPESALDDFETGFEKVSIQWQDDTTAQKVRSMLLQQKVALADAREKLRTLLATNFKIEEILFQGDTRPYR